MDMVIKFGLVIALYCGGAGAQTLVTEKESTAEALLTTLPKLTGKCV